MTFPWLTLAYVLCCAVAIAAILLQQGWRYRTARGCRWWLYSLLALGLAYEGLEAWKYGAPALPAGRWLLVPPLAAVLAWAAAKDWKRRSTYR
jgi:hypothetical protein